jgi:glyoxylase-like metal-dependent hydrolase (beta-lactamase superfamily II)
MGRVIIERSMNGTDFSNRYLVADQRGGAAVVIDAGEPVERLLAVAELHEVAPEYVLLTHHHHDHVGGVASYELGTAYGHIAIGASDLDAMLIRLAELGIEPERPPYTIREGGSRICFVRDPDGYRIEIVERSGEGRH